MGYMSLETFFEEPQTSQLFNTWWLPELVSCWGRGHVGSGGPSATYQNVQTVAIAQPLKRPLQHRYFNCLVSGKKIPDWFKYHKKVSNSNSCEIDIDEATDMFGEFTIIAFSAVVGIEDVKEEGYVTHKISAYAITTSGVEIFRGTAYLWRSAVWLHFRVPEYSFKLGSVDQVRVMFEVTKQVCLKSCGFHLVRLCNENAIDLIDEIQRKNRPCTVRGGDDGDGNLVSNWCPKQKRHSSTAEDTPPGEQS